MTSPDSTLHYKYWIGILIFVIVLVIALSWADIPGLVDKISFALTISSVILALLAIYFTVNFNSLFSNNVNTFLNLHQSIEKSSEKLIAATQNLNSKLDFMPQAITGVDKKVDRVQKMLEDGFSSTVKAKVEAEASLNTKQLEIDWTEEKLHHMFINTPFAGMLVMELLSKAYRKAFRFTSHDLISRLGEVPPDFFYAYAYALRSVGLCHLEVVNDTYVITNYNEILLNNVDKWLENAITVVSKRQSESLKEARLRIENFINAKNS